MYHPERNVRLFKHGDDFTLSGRREGIDFVTKELMKHIALKDRGRLAFQPSAGEVLEAKIQNRNSRVSAARFIDQRTTSRNSSPRPRSICKV